MTILFDATRPVNVRRLRTFGQGIPEAASGGASLKVATGPGRGRTAADEMWWAAECARIEADRAAPLTDRQFDSAAAESAALDALTRGLIPRDLAESIASTRIGGHAA